jgi:hypothetical protein
LRPLTASGARRSSVQTPKSQSRKCVAFSRFFLQFLGPPWFRRSFAHTARLPTAIETGDFKRFGSLETYLPAHFGGATLSR